MFHSFVIVQLVSFWARPSATRWHSILSSTWTSASTVTKFPHIRIKLLPFTFWYVWWCIAC